MTTVTAIVKEHLKASQAVRKSFRKSPAAAKRLLIDAGIINKQGTKLATLCR